MGEHHQCLHKYCFWNSYGAPIWQRHAYSHIHCKYICTLIIFVLGVHDNKDSCEAPFFGRLLLSNKLLSFFLVYWVVGPFPRKQDPKWWSEWKSESYTQNAPRKQDPEWWIVNTKRFCVYDSICIPMTILRFGCFSYNTFKKSPRTTIHESDILLFIL